MSHQPIETPFTLARGRRHPPSTTPCPQIPPIAVPDADPSSGCDSATSTPTRIPAGGLYSCIFDIRWDKLQHRDKLLVNPQYRLRHKRHIHYNSRPSGIYRHGADITAGGKNYWVCKICHTQRRYAEGVYPSDSTTNARRHLKDFHRIVIGDDGNDIRLDDLRPASPYEAASRTTTPSTSSNISESRRQFDERKYKEYYIDWLIHDRISFLQASSPWLRRLLTAPHIVPLSDTTVSSWVRDALPERKDHIKSLLQASESKVNVSCDLWTGYNKRNYVGVVAHWIGKYFNVCIYYIAHKL